jgi:CheY-like chemotaxis protein
MNLRDLIQRLGQARFDVDSEQILDALWLGSLGRDLSLYPEEAPRPPQHAASPPSVTGRAGSGESPGPARPVAERTLARPARPPGPVSTPVYPRGTVTPAEPTIKASPVALPAPKALPNRLALMRALRPFTQGWPSRQHVELDEEGTAELSASLGEVEAGLVLPVFKSHQERWFDVELVLEDVPSAVPWEDRMREFADLLSETGAFGQVRQWHLRMKGDGGHAYLENALGARVPATSLLGKAARRLIIFASDGTSPRWTNGGYARMLVPWLRDNAVLLLQLAPPERWGRSRLGEPHASVSTSAAGVAGVGLHVEPYWWRMPVDAEMDGEVPCALPLPVAALTPAGLGQWARMQMARGSASPAFLLDTRCAGELVDGDGSGASMYDPQANVEHAVSLLKYESPDSFRLAVLLSTAPFTLTVARLVQAIAFNGDTDPDLLAELMRTGVVVPASDDGRTPVDPSSAYYTVDAKARELLLRSLRDAEATALGREVQRRVSALLPSLAGSGTRSAQLIADEQGLHDLPAWARPFASVTMALLGLPPDARAAAQRVDNFLRSVPHGTAAEVVEAARAERSSARVVPEDFSADAWSTLVAARLVYQRNDDSWAFAPHVRRLLAAVTAGPDMDDGDIDWLEAALALLQSMALAFHIGQIPDGRGRETMRALLTDASGERASALAHWVEMSEYIFLGPLMSVLITGEDPFRHGNRDTQRQTFEAALAAWQQEVDPGSAPRTTLPTAVATLRNAVVLLSRRAPATFDSLLTPWVKDNLARFVADADPFCDDEAWRQTEQVVLRWLRNEDVIRAVAPFCDGFFTRLAFEGSSELAMCSDYGAYVGRLLALWREASESLFVRARGAATVAIYYPVARRYVTLARMRLPDCAIHVLEEASGVDQHEDSDEAVTWSVARGGYLALIDWLGDAVKKALAQRLAREPRRPHILWVDDAPDNNAVERTNHLAEGKLTYTLATSTDEALRLCEASLFDAVISDMERQGDRYAGYVLLDQLRRTSNKVPFIFYTADAQPGRVREAVKHGAIGITDQPGELGLLVMRALWRHDEVLDRPVDVESLMLYTRWRVPQMDVAEVGNTDLRIILNRSRYPTLLHVERAVAPVWDTVRAYARKSPERFETGTDYVATALSLVDEDVREHYWVDDATLFEIEHRANGVVNKLSSADGPDYTALDDDDNDEAVDESALAHALSNFVRAGALPDLNDAIELELEHAVDTATWVVEADSYLPFDTDDEHGDLLGWKFEPEGTDLFEPSSYADGTLVVTTRVRASVEVHCSFEFAVRDSIDKDMVPLGHVSASRKFRIHANVELAVKGVEDGRPVIKAVDVEHIVKQVDFGTIEPDGFDDDDDTEA